MDALSVEVFQHPLLWHIRCRRGASTPSLTKVIVSANKVAAPARFSLIDEYGQFLIYQMEIVFSETGVSADLLEAKANEAVSRFDSCSLAIMLANLGDKSAEEALACVEDKLGRND